MVHIHNGILLGLEKQDHAICSNMDRPRDCHAEWSKSDIEWQISHGWLYMASKKRVQMKSSTKQKQNYRCGKQTMVTRV